MVCIRADTHMSYSASATHGGAEIGSIHQARALMNVGNADSTFWTPVINLGR